MKARSARHSDLEPLSKDDMLGHVRPRSRRQVRLVDDSDRGGCLMRRFEISSYARDGEEVWMSLRLCLGDPQSREVVFSLPGGRGVFSTDLHWWLGQSFKKNYAVIDWLGRGESPVHSAIRCDFDPIFMATDDFREAFLFHNLSATWGALDWLRGEGFEVETLIGTSWGGVQTFLLAQLDDQLRTIYASFGCGGFSIPGVEKRNYWDDTLAHMGPRRAEAWFSAFDPYLRMDKLDAEVNFETATNDKFFSMDMAMETWRKVRRKGLLRIEPNQDHTIYPNGAQAYWLDKLGDDPAIQALKSFSNSPADWCILDDRICYVGAVPGDDARVELVSSAQLPDRGDMSREWVIAHPEHSPRALGFSLGSAHSAARRLIYGYAAAKAGRIDICAATPIWPLDPAKPAAAAGPAPERLALLVANGQDMWTAPIGDRMSPSVTAEEDGWRVSFDRAPWSRMARYGVKPWELPTDWGELLLRTAEPLVADQLGLHVMLSRNYHHANEEAVVAALANAKRREVDGLWEYVFTPGDFTPADTRHDRFGLTDQLSATSVTIDFDAVSLVDIAGACGSAILLKSIEVCA